MNNYIVFISALLLSIAAATAQDTTRIQHEPKAPVPPSKPQPKAVTPARQPDEYRQEDRIMVPHDQLPVSLQETLKESFYRGWENSPFYQDRITGDYILELQNSAAAPKIYRFNREGKMIENPNKPSKQTDQDR